MKTGLHLLAVMLFCLVGKALAAEGDAPKPKDAPNPQAAMAEKYFKALDTDADGMVTLDEFKAKKKGAALDKAEQIFKLSDTDADGKLTLKEFTHRPAEARFTQMDQNNDGQLTFEEFKGKREKPEEIEQAEQSFKRMDADGDKAVSLDEFKAAQAKPAGKKGAKKAVKKELKPAKAAEKEPA